MGKTTIKVSRETLELLKSLKKHPRETMESVISIDSKASLRCGAFGNNSLNKKLKIWEQQERLIA